MTHAGTIAIAIAREVRIDAPTKKVSRALGTPHTRLLYRV
jgi:hypothetical protein